MNKRPSSARTNSPRSRLLRIEQMENRRLLAADWLSHDRLTSAEGETTKLTWSIAPDGTPIEGIVGQTSGVSNLVSVLNQKFGSFDNWFGFVQQAFDAWDAIAGVDFVYEPADDGGEFPTSDGQPNDRGQIRLAGIQLASALNSTSTLGFATSRQDIVINTDIPDTNSLLTQLAYVVTHELGHVLGLDHTYPNNGTKLLESRENSDVFISPQFDDILRIQSVFGDQFEPNNSLADATDLGVLPIGVTNIGPVSVQNSSDEDIYSFIAAQDQQISVRVVPAGNPYLRAFQEQADYPTFDPRRESDLRLELRDSTGFLVGLASASGAGESEVLDRVRLPNGSRYSIRVTGDSSETQAYELVIELHPVGENFYTEQVGDTNWLTEQIDLANQSPIPVSINVPPGIYKLDQVLTISGHVTLIGTGTSSVLIDGQNKTSHFYADSGSTLNLQNMTLLRGRGDSGGSLQGYEAHVTLSNVVAIDNSAMLNGGALNVFRGSVRIERSTFSYNSSELSGGAIYLLETEATIEGSLISENKGQYSGGIDAQANLNLATTRILNNQPSGLSFGSEGAELNMRDSWVIGNHGEYGAGIGLGRGTSHLTRVHVQENEAIYSGGGIRLADQGVMYLSSSYISNNRANGSAGLAIDGGTTAHIQDSWFRKNQAGSTAGAIGISGYARIESTTISENEAVGWFGAGVGVSDFGEMLMINSTVTLNRANNSGAGVSSFAGGRLEVVNSTITDNETLLTNFDQGGGIHVHNLGSAVLTNTVVAGNQNGRVTDIFGEFDASHSFLAAVDEATVLLHQRNGNFIGSATEPLDPKLGVLAGNGGSTPTQRPAADSPLLKSGLNLSQSVRFDQRRVVRDLQPDIGAFEVPQGEDFTNLPPTLEPISDPPIHNLGLSSFQIELTGVSDGNQGLQQVFLSATSDNPALISEVKVNGLAEGKAQLTYQLRPNVSGLANITVTARDPGNDQWVGTDDDGLYQRSFQVVVADGFLAEAEQGANNVNVRRDASGGATTVLQPQTPLEIDFTVQQAMRLSDVLVRHNNLLVGSQLDIQIDGGNAIVIPLTATNNSGHFVIDSTQFDLAITAGTHRLRLILVGSGPVELDLLATISDSLPVIYIEDAVQLEPRQGNEFVDVRVYLSKPALNNVSFRITTTAQTATNGDGLSNDDNRDFAAVDLAFVIPAGESSATIPVSLFADRFQEQSEHFLANLSEVDRATIVRDQALVEIVDGPIVLGSPVQKRLKRAPEQLEIIYISLHTIGPTEFPPPAPPPQQPTLVVGELLASVFRRADVTRDGLVSALDALQVINYLNSGIATRSPLDVSGDNLVSALDVLHIVNEINAGNSGAGEGEFLAAKPYQALNNTGFIWDANHDLRRSKRSF